MVYGSDKLIRCCRTAAAVVNGITTILVLGKIGVSRVELIPTQIMIYLSNALLMHVTEYRSGQSSAQIGDTPAGINQGNHSVFVRNHSCSATGRSSSRMLEKHIHHAR